MKVWIWIVGTLRLCVVLPIWFYLIYRILTQIEANELTWFLFYIYVPAAFVMGFIEAIVKEAKG